MSGQHKNQVTADFGVNHTSGRVQIDSIVQEDELDEYTLSQSLRRQRGVSEIDVDEPETVEHRDTRQSL